MRDLRQTYTTMSGATITIRAWGLGYVQAASADFFAVTAYFAELARGDDVLSDGLPELRAQLLQRVIDHSVPDETDRRMISVGDLPDILGIIFEINGLEALLKRLLSVREKYLGILTESLSVHSPLSTPKRR